MTCGYSTMLGVLHNIYIMLLYSEQLFSSSEKLNDRHPDRIRFFLSKADTAGVESDRQVGIGTKHRNFLSEMMVLESRQ